MKQGITMKSLIWGCAVLALALGAGAEDAPKGALSLGAEGNVRQAFTLPYKEYKVSFPTMGVIREVKIKEGDVIKKGAEIMKQDDREDLAELRILELDVNEFPIQAAEAKLRAAEVEFKAKDNLNKANQGYNALEVERARAERDVAKAQYEVSKQELK